MIPFRAFATLIEVISGARKQATEEHLDFLEFYKDLVAIIDYDTAVEFGSIKVPTVVKGKLCEGYRLELTTADCIWWRTIIIDEKGRFASGAYAVQLEIWDRLANQIKTLELTPEQRQKILNLEFTPKVLQIADSAETG